MRRLENKVVVITGAASGIGRSSAVRFAREGAAVVLGDLDVEGGKSAVGECREQGGRALFLRCDVEREDDIRALIERAVSEFGRLDVTFNNAGVGGAVGTIEEVTAENWDRTFAILSRAVFLGMKYSVPEMRKARGGSIISTASVAGLRGGAGTHAYSAAKAAVINLTRSVALEVGEDRIRVNCICPGGINTPLIYTHVPGGKEVATAALSQLQPIPRAGTPEDVANMALFLASDESEWITGAAMVVDGGLMAGSALLGQPGGLPIELPTGFAGPSFENVAAAQRARGR
jgi:NAD(P)-dependent dehydrogenase (short-subunit alcohol dehydrogenase family)